MKLSASASLSEGKTDLIIPVFTGFKPDELVSHIPPGSKAAFAEAASDFKADSGSHITLYGSDIRIILLGLGKPNGASFPAYFRAARKFSASSGHQMRENITLLLAHLSKPERAGEALVNGLITGTYELGSWKEKAGEKPHVLDSDLSAITLLTDKTGDDAQQLVDAAVRGQLVALAQKQAMHLVNMPSNIQTPQFLAGFANDWGTQYGQKVTIFSGEEIEEKGLHALAAVNRGSEYPAEFIVMEYEPENATEDTKTVGLVGKGITFDTGGLSIKPSDGMYFMKSDMGGAAVVLGFMEAAASLKLDTRFVAVIPVTDNLIDSRSFKPSDIIGSYSGKTIEIFNTDAEGRLILADGLSWLTDNYKVDELFDFATLTGATVRALGYAAAGLFTPNDELAASISKSADSCGERVWRFPIWDEYKSDLHSDVADVRHASPSPVAGGITAAKFLEMFTREHPSWAHFDIAGVAFGESEFGKHKNGTAWGIRLLVDYFSKK
ncbi:MAG: leucyl aminopeptidase family protein [Balneolia bacterium]|nr:leucyl aminopeptidase family protein [Balneolia bacterium]